MGILDNLINKIRDRESNISIIHNNTENRLLFLKKIRLAGYLKLERLRTEWGRKEWGRERNSQENKDTSRQGERTTR